jgi:chromosome segregation ATPase
METSLMKTTNMLVQMRTSGANMLQDSEARAMAGQAKLVRDVEVYKSTCAAEIEACRQQMAFLKTAHQQKISLLQQQVSANAAQTNIVQEKVKAMDEAHQKEIGALGIRMTSLQATHQQLQSQREHEARSYQSSLSTHQATITSMTAKQKKELEGFEQRVSAATQQTQQLMRENAALKVDQNILKTNLARANQELREVQDQDNDFSCVLM